MTLLVRWEYSIIYFPDERFGGDEATLNYYGREGWELVTFDWRRGKAVLKRPLEIGSP